MFIGTGNGSCTADGACYSASSTRTLTCATSLPATGGNSTPRCKHSAAATPRLAVNTQRGHHRLRQLHRGRSLLLRLKHSHANLRHLVARYRRQLHASL